MISENEVSHSIGYVLYTTCSLEKINRIQSVVFIFPNFLALDTVYECHSIILYNMLATVLYTS
jgi:hypothetical protein